MKNISQRLRKLETAYRANLDRLTAFKLDTGGLFYVKDDPITYLLKNGTDTGQGRIVDIITPAGFQDPVSASIYEEIRNIIAEGGKNGK